MLTDNALAYDVRAHFGMPSDDALSIVEFYSHGEWTPAPGERQPDAMLVLALYQGGVSKIAVNCAGRVAEFETRELILRSGNGQVFDRPVS